MADEHAHQWRTVMAERFGYDTELALATADGNTPYVRTVNAYYEDGSFYIITSAASDKMRQIARNPAVAVAGEWFTAQGRGECLGWIGRESNRAVAEKLREVFCAWLGNGHVDLTNEDTVLLQVRLTHGILYDQGTRYELDFAPAEEQAAEQPKRESNPL